MRINNVMIARVSVIGCCLVGTPTATKQTGHGGNGEKKMKDMTVFERQSDDGPRHSPLFSLEVGGDSDVENNFPSKMVLFNNDLYRAERALLEEDEDQKIGYNQVSISHHHTTEYQVPKLILWYEQVCLSI